MINSTSTTSIRIQFTEDVEEISAEDISNYQIIRVSNSTPITLTGCTATRDDSDHTIVDIDHTLGGGQVQESYKVIVNNVKDSNENTVTTNTTGYFFGNYTYTNVILTDTLPTIDGNLAFSVTRVTTATSGVTNTWQYSGWGSPQLVFTPTGGTPAAAGVIRGPDVFTFTVSGIISNTIFADNGDGFSNGFKLTYSDDTKDYWFVRIGLFGKSP